MLNSECELIYRTSPPIINEELNALFAHAWEDHAWRDFTPVLNRSLAFICAYCEEHLIGFVNLVWDGQHHAFILDPTVDKHFRRRGIGVELVRRAVIEAENHGAKWLHVDFEPYLQDFYKKCGFENTTAGLMKLGKSK